MLQSLGHKRLEFLWLERFVADLHGFLTSSSIFHEEVSIVECTPIGIGHLIKGKLVQSLELNQVYMHDLWGIEIVNEVPILHRT